MIALEAFGSRPRPVQGQPSYDGRLVVVGRLAGVVRLVLLGAVVGVAISRLTRHLPDLWA